VPSLQGVDELSAEKSLAIVIRLADFSESSRVVTLFTRDFGKISAMAKGAKRLRGPFEAALDLLATCEVVFLRKSSGGLDILTEAKLRQRFTPAAGQIGHLYAGYYLAELLDATCEPCDAHPLLFQHALECLSDLATPYDLLSIVSRFELVLLREIGQLPAIDACTLCGAEVGNSPYYHYQPSLGGLACSVCAGVESRGARLSRDAVLAMNALLKNGAQPAELPRLTPLVRGELRTAMNLAMAHLLGHKPRTLRYLAL